VDQSRLGDAVQGKEKPRASALDLSEFRDPAQWFKASCLGTIACILLYTLYGFILVSSHAKILSSQAQLLLASGMEPLVKPGDPYLTGILHRIGSGLFFGATLGTLTAVGAMAFSLPPWLKHRFSPYDGIAYLILGGVNTYLGFSGEFPVASFVFGFASPVFFFLPWTLLIRRSRERGVNMRRWVVTALVASSPLFFIRALGPAPFEMIRDSMLTVPVMRTLSDFYYNHTLLAAHVIKPAQAQEQKVIAVSDEAPNIGPITHGSLWMITRDPCSVKGASIVVSRSELPCRSIILTDSRPVNAANRIIEKESKAFDRNERMRQGIGLFLFKGPLLLVVALFMLWFSLFVSNLWERSAIASLLVMIAYLALFTPAWKNLYERRELAAHKDRIASYILSEHEEKRYLALAVFPKEFTDRELIRFSKDESPRIRLRALFEAGERGGAQFEGVMEKALRDPQLNVRTKACWTLGRIGSAKAADLLEQTLRNDPSWYVRGYAYRALGRIRPAARIIRQD
jgi:uncharacterized membrane protein YhaH (DUF805 family)